jgi:hypothetical protein
MPTYFDSWQVAPGRIEEDTRGLRGQFAMTQTAPKCVELIGWVFPTLVITGPIWRSTIHLRRVVEDALTTTVDTVTGEDRRKCFAYNQYTTARRHTSTRARGQAEHGCCEDRFVFRPTATCVQAGQTSGATHQQGRGTSQKAACFLHQGNDSS